MTEEIAKSIIASVGRKQKEFRYIEHKLTDRGFNVVFADLPQKNMSDISGWFYTAGGIPLYVGRSWQLTGYVMVCEVKLP